MIKNIIIAIQFLLLLHISPAVADDNESPNMAVGDNEEEASQGVITSMDSFNEGGEQTSGSLQMAAEYANQSGNFEKAIKLCEKALDKDDNDIDIHKTYAQALDEKLKTEQNKDQALLDRCIKEWLIIYRSEVGDEKGLSFHGIDPFGHFYEDEDRSMLAKTRLVALTGRAPKLWETDIKYMKWVNRPKTVVAGKVLGQSKNQKANE